MRPYEALVRRLYQTNLFHPAKMGLSNIERLHQALGSPADKLPAVHIAGTNGKGSVALKMARSLQLGGIRTGLFVSPHVSCFRERMQVDGELISEESIERLLPQIFELCETEDIPATFFEITTALAFHHFRNSDVDAMVIEAGLGGRLDATNIIMPKVSIITSVGLDHTRILGETVEEIATDKAGIFKPGVPALVGKGCPAQLLESVAENRGSPFFQWENVLPREESPLPPAELSSDFDAQNTRLAEAGLRLLWRSNPQLRVDEAALKDGLIQRPPCRFELVHVDVTTSEGRTVRDTSQDMAGKVSVLLDVAHNPPAIESFFAKVAKDFPGKRLRLVAAFSGDKDFAVCLSTILQHVHPESIHLAEASTPRATPVADLVAALGYAAGGGFDPWKRAHSGSMSVRLAVRDAVNEAALSVDAEGTEGDLVIVCGTVFMMADARQELGFDEPQDSPVVAEVAGSHFRSLQDNVTLSGTDG